MNSIITVKKKNKEIKILSTQKESYLALGYSVIDEHGTIIESGNALTVGDMKALNDTLKVKNEELTSENKKLKAEVKKLKSEVEKLTKAE